MRRVKIVKLAPTGEGVARGPEGVGFVAGALPGEEVEAQVLETRRTFWRGRVLSVLLPSADRRRVPEEGCGGCDWPHFEIGAARRAKRELFLESMERIGRLPASAFGELPIVASPLAYRLRNRFQVAGRGATGSASREPFDSREARRGPLAPAEPALPTAVGPRERRADPPLPIAEGLPLVVGPVDGSRSPDPPGRIGAFAPWSHRIVPATSCDALTPTIRDALRQIEQALASADAPIAQLATLEDRGASRRVARITLASGAAEAGRPALRSLADRLMPHFEALRFEREDGRRIFETGPPRLTLEVEGRSFSAAVDVFFQSNRFVVEDLYRDVREEAQSVEPGRALDAFGGVGLLAGALLDAGHAVVSVESDPAASREAARTRSAWRDAARWSFVSTSVGSFLDRATEFPLVVADPPRAGLGAAATPLARLARRKLLYVSCEPATLARDLPAILKEGFSIAGARLYDMFPLTHRIEALVTLERA